MSLTYGKEAIRKHQLDAPLVGLGVGLLVLTAFVLAVSPSFIALPICVVGLVCCELGLP